MCCRRLSLDVTGISSVSGFVYAIPSCVVLIKSYFAGKYNCEKSFGLFYLASITVLRNYVLDLYNFHALERNCDETHSFNFEVANIIFRCRHRYSRNVCRLLCIRFYICYTLLSLITNVMVFYEED